MFSFFAYCKIELDGLIDIHYIFCIFEVVYRHCQVCYVLFLEISIF